VKSCDEFEGGFGWIQDEPMQRTSHALVAGGRVWVIDPVDEDGLEERIRAAGEPAGVIQLLDRHNRDCAAIAAALRVPLHYLETPPPFEAIPLRLPPRWREVSLWWPERRVLVCADALGTGSFFRAPADRIGVHPLLRLIPPRRLGRYDPLRILVGHGEGVHEAAGEALHEALATARRRIPSLVSGALRGRRG
jgi:hypothetical protein